MVLCKQNFIHSDYVHHCTLHRRQFFRLSDALEQIPKSIATKKRLTEINSNVVIDAHIMDATSTSLTPLLDGVDLVIDATDNFEIRLIINDLLQKLNIHWIFGTGVVCYVMSLMSLSM